MGGRGDYLNRGENSRLRITPVIQVDLIECQEGRANQTFSRRTSVSRFIAARQFEELGDGTSAKADREPAVCVRRQCDGYLPFGQRRL